MKHANWIATCLILVVSLSATLTAMSLGTVSPDATGAEPAVASGSSPDNHLGGTAHGDGVRSEVEVKLSQALIDPSSGEEVRCISYVLLFTGANDGVLVKVFGQQTVDTQTDRLISFPLVGIDPDPRTSGQGALSPHSYRVSISPPVDSTWGDASEESIVFSVTRTE